MKTRLFLFAAILLMVCYGCGEDEDSVDLSVDAVGLYSGTFAVVGTGQVSGTCLVARASNTSVTIKITAAGQSSPTSPEINLSDGGSGKIILSYADSEGTMNGTIVNKTLSLTIKSGKITETFNGTKQ